MNHILGFFKSMAVAFSIYSKIPMPQFKWGSREMKWHLCFFPLVGLVIGLAEYGWLIICRGTMIDSVAMTLVQVVIPVLVTGGFHLDGFMDVMDAVHSYQDREKKLEIMKDPRTGAFAVISLVTYFLIYIAFALTIESVEAEKFFCTFFFISRCMSGIAVCILPKARKVGMVYTASSAQNNIAVAVILLIQLVLVFVFLFWEIGISTGSILKGVLACGLLVVQWLLFLWFALWSKKKFGGINGDLCGFFLCMSELSSIVYLGILI